MPLPALNPPPKTGNRVLDQWNYELWRKLGEATLTAPLSVTGTSQNITGVLASANASPNLIKNSSNDGKSDSIDAGSNATVRVYGPGGVGSNWNHYRNKVSVGTYAAVTFTGKAYATRYYIGYDTALNTWTISTSFKDVTGDAMVVFSVLTVSAGGGGGSSGGGGAGAGGEGGVGGDGGGYGLLL